MSMALIALLVYTVGVKCRGINKKEEYAPEHVFSLSENTANKMLRFNMWDLIKHTKTHVVRTYPKGLRLNSTNYEPHRFWAAGAQLVAINWQTFGAVFSLSVSCISFFFSHDNSSQTWVT
jgi:phosphatidylinositol phospholipase C delta